MTKAPQLLNRNDELVNNGETIDMVEVTNDDDAHQDTLLSQSLPKNTMDPRMYVPIIDLCERVMHISGMGK